jgi:DNA topoisomerase I
VLKIPASWRVLQRNQLDDSKAIRRVRAVAGRKPGRQIDPVESAGAARLRYISQSATPGIRRIGSPKRFRYIHENGKPVNRTTAERARALGIPPAWRNVWICSDPNGHLQATGRDARGRKQYRYHPRWRVVRDETKFGRLSAFARALPRIRARTASDLRQRGLSRERVLATVVRLLEKTLIRVGNEEYARDNHSYGITTMQDGHARIGPSTIRFVFRGKSGKEHEVAIHEPCLARIVKACRDLPGHELFQYLDERGRRRLVGSGDVNAYLREISGEDFTAKDFRTWAGTVLAATTLAELRHKEPSAPATSRRLTKAIELVACRLGNTKAVCRKSYVHPVILDAYREGVTIQIDRLRLSSSKHPRGLTAEEWAVVNLLDRRARKAKIA